MPNALHGLGHARAQARAGGLGKGTSANFSGVASIS